MPGSKPWRVVVLIDEQEPVGWTQRRLDEIADEHGEIEVNVVAPTVPGSRLDLVTGDIDDSIDAAEARAQKAAEEADGADPSAAGAGDADPLLAVEDALATFDADQLVIARGAEKTSWFNEDLLGEARERLAIPVEEIVR